MLIRGQADVRALVAWRSWRRSRRRRNKVVRWFETTAAAVPSIVLLLHLTLRAAAADPELTQDNLPGVPARKDGVGKVELKAELVVVPEPNAGALLGIGGGVAFFLRRNRYASKTATAVA